MRPRFFSKYEWWYHLAMMPVLFAVGNYYFIGERYFTHLPTFWRGTALIFVLYWFSVVTLTLVIRAVIARFPEVRQTRPRLLVMLLAVGSLTVLLAVFDVGAYSLMPGLQVPFSWEAVWPILVLGGVFDVFLCAALGLFYTFEKWRQNQAESERLERMALQHQFDALKGQVNPHFLFNSLNTLSSLISEDTQQAEDFVEDLAKIYRYMLQAGKEEWVLVSAELDFLRVYARLLQVRYGRSLQVELPTEATYPDLALLPLSLQTLIDNAIKYNLMTAARPLRVQVEVMPSQQVRVQNNLQPKTRTIETGESGLKTLVNKYRLLTKEPVQVAETTTAFVVTLPLLKNTVPA